MIETAAARSHNANTRNRAPAREHGGQTVAAPRSTESAAPQASGLAQDPLGIRAFQRDLQWLAEHADPVPQRLHVIGDVEPDSALGSPPLQREWRDWLERGAHAVRVERTEEVCYHAGLTELESKAGVICPSCAIRDGEGKAIGQTGIRPGTVAHYRWPMRSAMARANHSRRRKGAPRAGEVAFAILAAGDWHLAMHRLVMRYPSLADPLFSLVVAKESVSEVRHRFRTEAPERVTRVRKSDAQLDAEAAR